MSQATSETTGSGLAAELEVEVQEAIDLCGGDARAVLRASLIASAFLQAEVDRLVAAVSTGFARGRVRRRVVNSMGQAMKAK